MHPISRRLEGLFVQFLTSHQSYVGDAVRRHWLVFEKGEGVNILVVSLPQIVPVQAARVVSIRVQVRQSRQTALSRSGAHAQSRSQQRHDQKVGGDGQVVGW